MAVLELLGLSACALPNESSERDREMLCERLLDDR